MKAYTVIVAEAYTLAVYACDHVTDLHVCFVLHCSKQCRIRSDPGWVVLL